MTCVNVLIFGDVFAYGFAEEFEFGNRVQNVGGE